MIRPLGICKCGRPYMYCNCAILDEAKRLKNKLTECMIIAGRIKGEINVMRSTESL